MNPRRAPSPSVPSKTGPPASMSLPVFIHLPHVDQSSSWRTTMNFPSAPTKPATIAAPARNWVNEVQFSLCTRGVSHTLGGQGGDSEAWTIAEPDISWASLLDDLEIERVVAQTVECVRIAGVRPASSPQSRPPPGAVLRSDFAIMSSPVGADAPVGLRRRLRKLGRIDHAFGVASRQSTCECSRGAFPSFVRVASHFPRTLCSRCVFREPALDFARRARRRRARCRQRLAARRCRSGGQPPRTGDVDK